MLRQVILVTAACDYCHAPARTRHEHEDVPALFADETEARQLLGLDDGDPAGWRELDSQLLVCPRCARDCVLGGGHYFTQWAACGCRGFGDNHAPAPVGDGCVYETRTCPSCDTAENRPGTTGRRAGTP